LGICFVDQVGVKAPGRPTNKMDLCLANSAKLYFFGGKPRWSSTLGNLSPTEAKERVEDWNNNNDDGLRRAAVEARRLANNSDMVNDRKKKKKKNRRIQLGVNEVECCEAIRRYHIPKSIVDSSIRILGGVLLTR
jgi:hypothetical protein